MRNRKMKFRLIHVLTFTLIYINFWRHIIFKREEESLASSLLNIIFRQSKSDYMGRALEQPQLQSCAGVG